MGADKRHQIGVQCPSIPVDIDGLRGQREEVYVVHHNKFRPTPLRCEHFLVNGFVGCPRYPFAQIYLF